jgi:hypothetical protein
MPSEQGFRIGIFLPRDDPDWFGRFKFPPRLLVLGADSILVLTHPNCGGGSVRIPLAELAFYEVGHIFLIGRLQFTTAASEVLLPYNARSDRHITEFLDVLAQAYLPGERDRGSCEISAYGEPLDIKFRNHLQTALKEGERIHAQWFSPSAQVWRRWGPFRVPSQVPGDLVALTDRKILWITDRWEGHFERYGSMTSIGPLRGIESVRCEGAGAGSALTICFRGAAAAWHIPVQPGYIEAAQVFAESLAACL